METGYFWCSPDHSGRTGYSWQVGLHKGLFSLHQSGSKIQYSDIEFPPFFLSSEEANRILFARKFCQSMTFRYVIVACCDFPVIILHPPAILQLCDRSFYGTHRNKIHAAQCDGTVHRCHWSEGNLPLSVCDQCPQ